MMAELFHLKHAGLWIIGAMQDSALGFFQLCRLELPAVSTSYKAVYSD